MDAYFKNHIHERVFRTMSFIRVKICSMNLGISQYDRKWAAGNALDVLLAFCDETWRRHTLVGMRDEGISDRNDG